MARRPPGGIFGDAWVFPGGLAEPEDGADLETALPKAAARELAEEVGLEIDPAELVFVSRWITPEFMPKRYDTWFFLTSVRAEPKLTLNNDELVEAAFVSPSVALGAYQAQQWKVLLPTLAHLRWLSRHPSPEVAIAAAASHSPVEPVTPELAEDGSILGADLPW